MAECGEWVGLSPKARRDKTFNKRVCFMCLKSKKVCKTRMFIPALLICQGCERWAAQNGWESSNILMCIRRENPEIRADKINTNISESTLCVSSNFMYQNCVAGKTKLSSRDKARLEKLSAASSFNTRTGRMVRGEVERI